MIRHNEVELQEIEQLIKLAKKYKLKLMTVYGVEFEFREIRQRHPSRAVTPKEIPVYGERMPSDDEMLYYSADSAIQVPKT